MGCVGRGTGMLRALVFVALALCVVVAIGDETYSKGEEDKMSKEDLVSALMKMQKSSGRTRSELESARKQIRDLHNELHGPRKIKHFDEKHREMRESQHKAMLKKKHDQKKKAKLAKKEKLSDILMDHGAKYLSMKAAKEHKDEHSDKQMKKVLRAAAVAAVKKTRAQLKKSKKHHSKRKLRSLCLEAAKNALKKVLKEQDALIEKAAKKWAHVAIAKYPPAIVVSSHPEKPNHFTAPPMIHLTLGGGLTPPKKEAKKAVHKAKKAVKKAAKKAIKKAAKAPKKVKKVAKKVAKKVVAKAAAKAKKAAGKVVPEKH